MAISIKTPEDIEGMRIAGRLGSEVLDMLTPHVKAGVTTEQLDKLAHDYIFEVQQAVPAPLNYCPPGYTPYPKSICTSINHQVCHGIPNDRPLKDGDIVNIDVTVIKDGWHGDTSRMFVVGKGSIAANRLCQITYEAMWRGIEKVRPGARLGDIGHAIQVFAENMNLPVGASFRCQDFFDNDHKNYAGDVGIGINPKLAERVKNADLLLVVGARLGEMTTSGYTLLEPPVPQMDLVHVHASPEELGRVYQAALPINSGMQGFAKMARDLKPVDHSAWDAQTAAARAEFEAWQKHDANAGADASGDDDGDTAHRSSSSSNPAPWRRRPD